MKMSADAPPRKPGGNGPDLDPGARDMLRDVRRRCQRLQRSRREGDRSIWSNIGYMGLVGWSVTAPALAGAFLGRYLDARWKTGTVLTLSGLVGGLALGCWGAWRLIQQRRE